MLYLQYEALERENLDLHRFLTEALGEVDRLKQVERQLKSELSLVKRDKATLLAKVEELEARRTAEAEEAARQAAEAEEAARQAAEAEEAARQAAEAEEAARQAAEAEEAARQAAEAEEAAR